MLHFFNPGHEYALINLSPYYTASSNMAKMQQELAFILAWQANEGDAVLIRDELTEEFCTYIQAIAPKVYPISLEKIEENKTLLQNQMVELWGISPQAIHFFEELDKQFSLNLHLPKWNEQLAGLSSRKMAQQCLSSLIATNKEIESDIIPQFHTSLDSIEQLVASSPHQLLAKSPYSSSGRGLLWLPIGELTRVERQILHGMIKKQACVSVEKALNKKLDFAMEFKVGKDGVDFLGYSLFKTNKKGAYLCNYLGSQENILKEIGDLISTDILENIKADLILFIKDNYSSVYEGFMGVDMMVYEKDGQFFLQPCVEINMRNNMGILSLNLSDKYLAPNAKGYLYFDFSAKGEILQRHINDCQNYPLETESGRIKSGYLPLCPVTEKNSYRAYLLIE